MKMTNEWGEDKVALLRVAGIYMQFFSAENMQIKG
jgi:hypothetical protein